MNGQPKKSIKLALQGGGSHGAFTWGVLDRLLEDERLHIAAVSGTSAGAMNAVALADGMARGGPAEALAASHANHRFLGVVRFGGAQSISSRHGWKYAAQSPPVRSF